MTEDPSDAGLDQTWDVLHETRPTAINLRWALDDMRTMLRPMPETQRAEAAYQRAATIAAEDVELDAQGGPSTILCRRRRDAQGEDGREKSPVRRGLQGESGQVMTTLLPA